MSVKAIHWAFEQDLKPSAKVVLLALADYANDDGECWPGLDVIMHKSRLSRRAVQKQIKALEEAGIIARAARYRDNGSNASNQYILKMAVDDPQNIGGAKYAPPRTSEEQKCTEEEQKDDEQPTQEGVQNMHGGVQNMHGGGVPRCAPYIEPPLEPLPPKAPLGADQGKNSGQENKIVAPEVVEQDFSRFWQDYPNQQSRPQALAAYAVARGEGVSAAWIADGLRHYNANLRKNGHSAMLPTSWLRKRGWEDVPDPDERAAQRRRGMGGTDAALWGRIERLFIARFGDAAFRSWLLDVEFRGAESGGGYEIVTGSAFKADKIRGDYLHAISGMLAELAVEGAPAPAVEIVVEKAPSPEERIKV
ncbi:MAG: hypothetical protein CMF31_05175 [Kordiimonas sp.]|nr:hypothetical protein [Kordiimonas sp.]